MERPIPDSLPRAAVPTPIGPKEASYKPTRLFGSAVPLKISVLSAVMPSAAAVSGYANITVPAGFVFGLPVGMSFIGPAFSEPTLLRLAYAFEQATNVRRAPRLLPTADLTA